MRSIWCCDRPPCRGHPTPERPRAGKEQSSGRSLRKDILLTLVDAEMTLPLALAGSPLALLSLPASNERSNYLHRTVRSYPTELATEDFAKCLSGRLLCSEPQALCSPCKGRYASHCNILQTMDCPPALTESCSDNLKWYVRCAKCDLQAKVPIEILARTVGSQRL